MDFYFQLFWIPAAVSAVQLLLLSAQRGFDRGVLFLLVWLVVAAVGQIWAPTAGVWIAAVLGQTGLAIYVILQRQWEA